MLKTLYVLTIFTYFGSLNMYPKIVQKVSDIHSKIASQTMLQAASILAPTWLHFGLVLAPKLKPNWHQVAPKIYPKSKQKMITLWIANLAQLGPNLAPTWPNLAQLGPNLAPTWPSSWAPNPTWPQLGPIWPHLGPNLAQLGPNLAPIWPQLGPTWPQLGPNLPKLGPNLASTCLNLAPNWAINASPALIIVLHNLSPQSFFAILVCIPDTSIGYGDEHEDICRYADI